MSSAKKINPHTLSLQKKSIHGFESSKNEAKPSFRRAHKSVGVKTRYPPSPTGFWHIGQARTALFNYLFSKKNNGSFVFRFEDTDKERSKKEFEDDIIDGLKWLGLLWDEGPFRQSDRLEIYSKYLKELLEKNHAYYCFCTSEELKQRSEEMMSRGVAPKYAGTCSALSKEIVAQKLGNNEPYVIRFRMPEKKYKVHDLVRGVVEFDGSLVGDFVIARDLNSPLYNFAVVIDDHEMGITHVIRGEDLLSNTPKQIAMLDVFEWDYPQFAHLPLILNPDRSKMSKRFMATAVHEYRKQGYLPEAIINFVALLGWNPGTNQEIFSLAGLEKAFDLEKVQKAGAVFNIEKLQWFNAHYIRNTDNSLLVQLCIPYWEEAKILEKKSADSYENLFTHEIVSVQWLEKIVIVFKDRLKMLSEISELSRYLFVRLPEYERNLLQWKQTSWEVIKDNLDFMVSKLEIVEQKDFNALHLQGMLMEEIKKRGTGETLWPVRFALSGLSASLGPFDIMEILGKEKTLERLRHAISKI